MNLGEKIKSQRIIIATALILMSLASFKLAVIGPNKIVAFLLGLTFLGIGFFVLFGLKKKD
ncbi:MAG: hypothetical protein OEZ52_04175 [Candidatus Aminicenantes bacterium]|nr:hypothetical protein [Candidatus Aminicenantes bacterium]MDH5742718.1 hypothetical protein [Candidatus Aminicenantes bacterium]